mgnify:CR=1 FL=1
MIKLEIKIKEEGKQDFEKVLATALNVELKEKSKRVSKAEQEALDFYKKKMGFDNNLLVVNRCKNQENFEEVKDKLIEDNI